MENKPILLATWIMAPDGTMLPSFYNHDYREHTTIDKQERQHPEGAEEPEEMFSDDWKKWFTETSMVVTESRFSMVDGGTEPWSGRRGGTYTEMSVYSNDPYEVIRRFLCRGGRGKESKDHLTWTPLFAINDNWLKALIEFEENRNPNNVYLKYYKKELEYRLENNIKIEE